jgi:hypothetical protein
MLKKYLLGPIFLLSCFNSILSESSCVMEDRENINTYYLKVDGMNTGSCTSSTVDLCESFEHVMKDLHFPKIVYIQPADYEYGTSQEIISSFEINEVTESGIDVEDISTYPVITFSSQDTSIRFSSPGYFHHLKILWGNMTISPTTSILDVFFLFLSFFFFNCFFFFLTFFFFLIYF